MPSVPLVLRAFGALLAVVSGVVAFLQQQGLGFPDGSLTEADRAAEPLYGLVVGTSLGLVVTLAVSSRLGPWAMRLTMALGGLTGIWWLGVGAAYQWLPSGGGG